METTIAVNENTLQLLAILKKRMNARNIDEVIIKIAQKAENLPKSRFGSQPALKQFREEERAHAHDL